MKRLNEYEPWPDEYRFKQRQDVKYFAKALILIRWWVIKLFIAKKDYLSTSYPNGIIPPRNMR